MNAAALLVRAADSASADAIVSDGGDGSLWGITLPAGTFLIAKDRWALIASEYAVLDELDENRPAGVEYFQTFEYDLSALSINQLTYYLLGKASS